MEGFWSLTFFTVFAQAAVGLTILKTLSTAPNGESSTKLPIWLVVALGLLGLATGMSLLHLAAPFSAYYSILNAATSWLTLEILAVCAFGAALCVYYFIRTICVRYLASILGILLLYAMARVYMLQTVATWNSYLTFASFVTAALLLGATLLFALKLRECRHNMLKWRLLLSGWLPITIGFALSAHAIILAWQAISFGDALHIEIFLGQYVLVFLGAMLGFIAILRALKPAEVVSVACPSCIVTLFALASLLIWAGVIGGRVVFYMSYTYFGM